MPLDKEVDVGPGDIVLHGTQLFPKRRSPQFSAHVCCGQTAGWIKMPLDIDVGPGDIVLHGGPALPKGAQPPIFGSCLLWPNGWMDQDAILARR